MVDIGWADKLPQDMRERLLVSKAIQFFFVYGRTPSPAEAMAFRLPSEERT